MDSYVTCNNKTRVYLMQLPSGTTQESILPAVIICKNKIKIFWKNIRKVDRSQNTTTILFSKTTCFDLGQAILRFTFQPRQKHILLNKTIQLCADFYQVHALSYCITKRDAPGHNLEEMFKCNNSTEKISVRVTCSNKTETYWTYLIHVTTQKDTCCLHLSPAQKKMYQIHWSM